MSEPFEISDYLLGEMDAEEQRRAERLMREDPALRRRVEGLAAVCGRLESLPPEAWDPPPLPPSPSPDPEDPVEAERAKPRRRARLSLRPLAVGACSIGLIGVGAAGGWMLSEDNGSAGSEEDADQQELVLNPIASLQPPPEGRIVISGEEESQEAQLTLEQMPPSGRAVYEVWLLDGTRGQLSLGSFAVPESGDTAVEVPLPVEPSGFTYVDVSREPPDGDPAHSGFSVLRAPTSAVASSP